MEMDINIEEFEVGVELRRAVRRDRFTIRFHQGIMLLVIGVFTVIPLLANIHLIGLMYIRHLWRRRIRNGVGSI